MRHAFKTTAVALGFAGALAMSVPSAGFATPVTTGTAGIKAATTALPNGTTEVRWRGHGGGYGGAVVGGLALGLVGAAAANAYGPYYGPGYYYGGPYYRPYAYYGPGPYYGRPYLRHRHWHRHAWHHH